jgi:uncharacterized protein (TIGR02246 family)
VNFHRHAPRQCFVGVIIAGLMKAWNTHDMHAFAKLFAEDASFVNLNASWLERADQIKASHQIVHNSFKKDSIADIRPAKIRIVQPDLAVVQATWQIRGDSRRSEPRDYIVTLVLRKQDERWKILACVELLSRKPDLVRFCKPAHWRRRVTSCSTGPKRSG